MTESDLQHPAKEFAAPLATSFLTMLSMGFFFTFLTLRLQANQASEIEIGLVHSAYYLGMLIGAVYMEAIVRWLGHVQALAAFGALSAATIAAQALLTPVWCWMILRILSGLSMAALYVIVDTWMVERSHLSKRGTALAMYIIALYSGQALGQQFIPLVDITSNTPFLLASLFTSLSIIPIALVTRRLVTPAKEHSTNLLYFAKNAPFGFIGCFASGFIAGSFYSFLPIYGEGFGHPGEQIVAITLVGGIFLQLPLGKISDIFDRRTVLMTVFFSACIPSFCLIVPWIAKSYFVYLFSFLVGGLCISIYPLSITHVCDRLYPHQMTKAMGALLVAYGIGSAMGPLISSKVIAVMGPVGIYYLVLFVLIIFGIVGLFSMLLIPPVPADEQHSFQASPPTSSLASEIGSEENKEK